MRTKRTTIFILFGVLIICLVSNQIYQSISQKDHKEILWGKQYNPEDWIRDTIDFVIDSTLQRQYLNENFPTAKIVHRSIENVKQLYNIIEPLLNEAFGEENMTAQKPFHINKIDSIWIIEGSLPRLKDGDDVLGGVFYLEIGKNGTLIKAIHSE